MRALKDKSNEEESKAIIVANHHPEDIPVVAIPRSVLKSLCKVLTLVSLADSARAYCTNYEGIHGPSLWRDPQDTSTHNDGVCGIFQVPGTKGENIPLVVSYNEAMVGNLAQRILQSCSNITSWVIPDNYYWPAFDQVDSYCSGGIYQQQAAAWEFSMSLEDGNYLRASEMDCIRRQIGCNNEIWNSWTFWFKTILVCVAVGIPLLVFAGVKLRRHFNESRVEVLPDQSDIEAATEGESLLQADEVEENQPQFN